MMRHWVSRAVLVSLVAVRGGAACSSDDAPGPPAAGGGSEAGARSNEAGSPAAAGEPNSAAGGSAAGAAAESAGGATFSGAVGAPSGASGEPNAPSVGGATAENGGSTSEPEPAPPDLITKSGGPWPDSFTPSCATPQRAIVCPQTGDAFFGQDGTYRLNVPTYKTTSTTLTDSVTGLQWQLVPEEGQLRTQASAASYCEELALAGQTDWRLPTRLEYLSVLDEGSSAGYCMPPSIPQSGLGPTWTASPTGTTAGQFFIVDEQSGTWSLGSEDNQRSARCVRGATFAGAWQVDTDVATDTMTQLVWQTTSLDETLVTWQDALAYCEGLTHAGKSDWRLPSIKELGTLVDESATVPPVLYAGLGGTAGKYWSSTPAPRIPGGGERFAFALETGFGMSASHNMTETAAAARCVRTAD